MGKKSGWHPEFCIRGYCCGFYAKKKKKSYLAKLFMWLVLLVWLLLVLYLLLVKYAPETVKNMKKKSREFWAWLTGRNSGDKKSKPSDGEPSDKSNKKEGKPQKEPRSEDDNNSKPSDGEPSDKSNKKEGKPQKEPRSEDDKRSKPSDGEPSDKSNKKEGKPQKESKREDENKNNASKTKPETSQEDSDQGRSKSKKTKADAEADAKESDDQDNLGNSNEDETEAEEQSLRPTGLSSAPSESIYAPPSKPNKPSSVSGQSVNRDYEDDRERKNTNKFDGSKSEDNASVKGPRRRPGD